MQFPWTFRDAAYPALGGAVRVVRHPYLKGEVMKSIKTPVAGLIGVVVAIAPMALAVDAGPKTLEQCAALLPSGKTYSFRMSGTIDLTQGKPILQGEFSVEDGTQIDRRNESEPFGKCLAALIK